MDCGLRTADCGLRTADCGLRTADCGLRTADCRLGIKQGRDQNSPKNVIYYGLQLIECQKWKEHIKNTTMAKFEATGIKSKFTRHFEFLENLEDIYGKCCWRARSCSPATFSILIFLVL